MSTVTLRYLGPATRYRFPAANIDVRIGDEISVDAERDILTHVDDDGDEHHERLDDFLVERHGFERVGPDATDVLEQSVDALEDALATGEYDAQLDALAHAEREEENRTTALEAIDNRRTEVE